MSDYLTELADTEEKVSDILAVRDNPDGIEDEQLLACTQWERDLYAELLDDLVDARRGLGLVQKLQIAKSTRDRLR